MSDNAKRTGAAVKAHYQFVIWLAAVIEARRVGKGGMRTV
jgi:hypothetical protein